MNWPLLIASYLGLIAVGLIDNGRGALYYEIIDTFKITNQVGAQIFALASLASLLTLLTSRWWLRYFNILRSHGSFLLVQSIGCFGIGYSIKTPWPLLFLLTSCFVFGISLGGTSVSCNLLISKGSPLSYQRRTYAGLHSMYGIASFLSPLLISLLRAHALNWSSCFILFSIIPLLCALASFLFSYQKSVSGINAPSVSKISRSLRLHIGLIFSLYVAAEIAISSRLTFYVAHTQKVDSNLARTYLSLFFAFLLLGRISFGTFKLPKNNLFWLKTSLISSLIFSLIGLTIDPFGFSLCGLSMSFFFPCGMSWINEMAKDKSENIISATMTWIGIMLIIMHWLVGYLASLFSIKIALFIIPINLMISLLALQYFKKDKI